MIRTTLCALAFAAFALFATAPAYAAVECNQVALYDSNATGATKLVTGSAKAPIYVCGYTLVAGGTTNVSIKSGTGTNCGTNTAAVTPAYSMVANGLVHDDSSVWRGLTVPAGQDMCINSSGTTIAVQALIFFKQF